MRIEEVADLQKRIDAAKKKKERINGKLEEIHTQIKKVHGCASISELKEKQEKQQRYIDHLNIEIEKELTELEEIMKKESS